MKTEKTYKQVIEFDIVSANYLAEKKNERDEKDKDKVTTLEKCIELMQKQIRKIMPDFYEKRDLIRLEHCTKDEKTRRLILSEGDKDYTFTEEGLKKVKEKIKELEQETVTIHKRILPENNTFKLTLLQKDAFADFVIDATEDEFEKQFEKLEAVK